MNGNIGWRMNEKTFPFYHNTINLDISNVSLSPLCFVGMFLFPCVFLSLLGPLPTSHSHPNIYRDVYICTMHCVTILSFLFTAFFFSLHS